MQDTHYCLLCIFRIPKNFLKYWVIMLSYWLYESVSFYRIMNKDKRYRYSHHKT
ncbi:hypothetical protein LV89_04155 [Arcicella aurantiaca]|uniref:Uncharacterized protein n=1 Tax=Arcicella aurantiaca TaxID=591202 RepID=A0A316DKN0_9BACT|nr:hypothetical protein [Arcicella aurantiaca]PWK18128.1 hypothetical protein LV89_04155 [Arcicella aurantiaca]